MYNQTMIVYGELLFIENTIIGGVLLYLTGEIFRQKPHGFRLMAGSIMCGAFSLVIFTGAKAPLMLLMEGFFATAVSIVVFGCQGRPFIKSVRSFAMRKAAVFILITYFMGGITMGLLLLTEQQGIYTAAGIYTGDMKAALLALFILAGYMTIKQVIKTVRDAKLYTEHNYDAEIAINEHRLNVKAFLDTGNRLKEPITGKPVAIASERLWKIIEETLGNEGTQTMSDVRFALIPYEAVGSKGLLHALRTDYIKVSERKIDGCFIARAEKDFAFGKNAGRHEGYDLLISGEMT